MSRLLTFHQFIVTGIMSILAGQCPSICLVGFTVFMNISGAIFAITAIVLYAIDLANTSLLWMCDGSWNNAGYYGDKCRNVALFAQNLLTSTDALLIALAVVQLFVSIRYAILGIGALCSKMLKEETLQIMVGLFNIGLGPGRTSFHPEDFTNLGAAYWLGGVFILTGIITVLVSCYPSYVAVGFAVFINLIASVIGVLGIVLYAMDLQAASFVWLCNNKSSSDNCIYVAYYLERLTTGMDITMIVMTGLQLFVSVTFTVLGIQALCGRMKNKGDEDAEIHKPLLKEVLMTSPGA
ncbi:hypothetical protein D9C73_016613 [Collichthys lucidus]|uniref:Uncharacterized protein n=1 Tax=Collichthys lucidus TaxID=240159 RepID=A0A4U5V3T3_COLLU|nr:hypothetical protein D9C73_016613 [Collichthys lucidus]